jgi:A/G-specific adenine glycosylase
MVSEVMLQQTQVSTVQNYYLGWMARFPTIASLAAAPESEVLHAWQGLGYYTRARNLHAAAKMVVSRHSGAVPSVVDVLRELPGMGRYTANAITTFAFDQSVPIVEANITRVLARLFNIRAPVDSATGREQLWEKAETLVPKTGAGRFNSALMDLGALICVRQKPKCSQCPVKAFCRAKKPDLLPIKKPAPKTLSLTESHSFTLNRDRIFLEQCSKRWRGMWMLPSLPSGGDVKRRPIHTSVFPFTNHRVTLQVFDVATTCGSPGRGKRSDWPSTATKPTTQSAVVGRAHRWADPPDRQRKNRRRLWVKITELNTVPIPSPHRRAIVACLSLDVRR